MRILLIVMPFFFILPIVDFKKKEEFKDDVFTGKLIIKGPCGQRVVSIISPITINLKVQENWEDPVSGELYKNVFSVRNFCEVSSLEEGDTFYFKFIKMKMSVCPACLLYRPVPGVEGAIVIVKKHTSESFKQVRN
jgi:hypothetical protein